MNMADLRMEMQLALELFEIDEDFEGDVQVELAHKELIFTYGDKHHSVNFEK